MSQTPIHTSDQAEWYINHALKSAGLNRQVTARIVKDTLIIRLESASDDSGALGIARTGFGHWFAESVVPQAMEVFGLPGSDG